MPIDFKVESKDVRRLLNRMKSLLRRVPAIYTRIHKDAVTQGERWAKSNIDKQGGLLSTGKWPKLSPNTLAKRRIVFGRSDRKALQSLKNYFETSFNSRRGVLRNTHPQAGIHEGGAGPYDINSSTLMKFPVASARGIRRRSRTTGRSRNVRSNWVQTRQVKGLIIPQRRIMPNDVEFAPIFTKIIENEAIKIDKEL